MAVNFRQIEATDPFGRKWTAEFRWQQNAISIRHADAIDCKYYISNGEEKRELVVSLPHAVLANAARESGRELADAWCMRVAALHVEYMIRTWEDMEKTIVTLSPKEVSAWSERIADEEREERAKAALSR